MVKVSDELIVLDDGHGMSTPGKRTPVFKDGTKSNETGKPFMHENEFNRAVVKYLGAELKAHGFKVLYSAPTDEDTPLAARVNFANNKKANLFISVHANALSGTWAKGGRGIETFVSNSAASKKLGALVQEELLKGTPMIDRKVKDGTHLYVIRKTNMPSILIEAGFMDDDREARLLMSDSYRRECASEIARAVCRYYGIPYKGTTGGNAPSPSKPNPPAQSNTDTSKGIGLAVVKVDSLSLRKGPGSNFEKVRDLKKGERFYVYGEKDGWYDLGGGQWASNVKNAYMDFAKHEKKLYRVRKTWTDAASQKGAFESFAMAKGEADKHAGYHVYDAAGQVVHTSVKKPEAPGANNSGADQKVSGRLEKDVQKAIEAGITDGSRPKDTATREEIMAMFGRHVQNKENN